jgi:NAD(P)-dependent dehydrogenase (short-subunit alcohol dehydrogenase family)
MTRRLVGKTVVITGAGNGQGQTAAVLFAREGADLVLSDIDVDGLRETEKLVRAEVDVDVDVLTMRCDVASVAEVQAFAEAAMRRHEAIHVVYNNAGVILRCAIADTTEDAWDRVFDINVKGVFFLVKHLLPGLIAAGSASVVNVSSIAGLTPPREGNTAYAASKAAVIALTKAQARDLAPHGIRVNCLVPGPIDTAMPAGAFVGMSPQQREQAMAAAVDRNMIKRFGRPEEVAAVAVFLATPEASYLTGASIPVDGGRTAT